MKKKIDENSNLSKMQKCNLQKTPFKETKILQDNYYYNSIIKLIKAQVSTQAKISSFKHPHIKLDLY